MDLKGFLLFEGVVVGVFAWSVIFD